jgi:hypothetical protein
MRGGLYGPEPLPFPTKLVFLMQFMPEKSEHKLFPARCGSNRSAHRAVPTPAGVVAITVQSVMFSETLTRMSIVGRHRKVYDMPDSHLLIPRRPYELPCLLMPSS